MALTDRITADSPSWDSRGVQLVSWGPDIVNGTVQVHLEQYSRAAAGLVQGWVTSDLWC
jgi:hypothetical protein